MEINRNGCFPGCFCFFSKHRVSPPDAKDYHHHRVDPEKNTHKNGEDTRKVFTRKRDLPACVVDPLRPGKKQLALKICSAEKLGDLTFFEANLQGSCLNNPKAQQFLWMDMVISNHFLCKDLDNQIFQPFSNHKDLGAIIQLIANHF